MATTLTVPRILRYPPVMNYELLRREGLNHLERLGPAIWTDFNSHDPGITILEVLCYALTDLGYRSKLPATDLFAPASSYRSFFTALEILPNSPVTALDFRKILIDIEGVKNAWLKAVEKEKLPVQFDFTKEVDALNIPGLKRYVDEFSKDDTNLPKLAFSQDEANPWETVLAQPDAERAMATLFEKGLSDVSKPKNDQLKALILFLLENHFADIENWTRSHLEDGYQRAVAPAKSFLQMLRLLRAELRLYWTLTDAKKAEVGLPTWAEFDASAITGGVFLTSIVYPYLTAYLLKNSLLPVKNEDSKYKLFIPRGVYKVYLQLENGYDSREDRIRQTALARLHANRALCEDFDPDIQVVETVGLGVDTVIEVAPGADPVQVYADIRYAVGNFLSPAVRMYSLQEMTEKYADGDKNFDSDPIFRGPVLTHGFIDDDELAAANWRRTVYKSDLFQIVSSVENVVRVQKLNIKKCGDKPQDSDWCLKFECECQPEWDLRCSKVQFTKGGRPVPFQESMEWEVQDKLEQLLTQNAKIDRTGSMDIPVPAGIQRIDLAEYTSVQEEFPRTYHIGREGIISSETPLRKAQVKQLKGYLMFFDQILANYLSQLAQVREALAIEKPENKTPLYQTLYEVPFVKTLFSALTPGEDWEAFKSDPENAYVKSLQKLTNGSDVTFRLRQNQILDHLLARFGEAFTDYASELFNIAYPLEESPGNEDDVKHWLKDKRRFLKNLPALSSLRARGFNYLAEPEDQNQHFWDCENIEGFKRRVLAQLGVREWSRRTVSVLPRFVVDIKLEMVGKARRYRFGIKSEEDSPTFWMTSTALFSQTDSANHEGNRFLSQSADISHYGVSADEAKTFWYAGFWDKEVVGAGSSFTESPENAVMLSEPFGSEDEAKDFLRKVTDFVDDQGSSDNFHVVEHLLLRPLTDDYVILKPKSVPADFGSLDAYSFRITVIVPGWVGRFNDPAKYAHFEMLVRSELPAHVLPTFVTLDRSKMIGFEETYYDWLIVKTDPATESYDLRKATNALIDLLNEY